MLAMTHACHDSLHYHCRKSTSCGIDPKSTRDRFASKSAAMHEVTQMFTKPNDLQATHPQDLSAFPDVPGDVLINSSSRCHGTLVDFGLLLLRDKVSTNECDRDKHLCCRGHGAAQQYYCSAAKQLRRAAASAYLNHCKPPAQSLLHCAGPRILYLCLLNRT